MLKDRLGADGIFQDGVKIPEDVSKTEHESGWKLSETSEITSAVQFQILTMFVLERRPLFQLFFAS